MNKIIISGLLIVLNVIAVNAQHKIYFEPKLESVKTNHSLYNSLKIIDSRADTNLGFVQTGAFNRRAIVVTKQPMAKELSVIFSTLIGQGAAKGEMLLHLRQFSFAELTGSLSEIGYFSFQADLYAAVLDKFQLIGSIDTLFKLRSSVDVTNSLLRTGSDTLTGFIQSHLLMPPANSPAYTYQDVAKMDSVEKLKIKLYNTSAYVDGLYLSYQSFKNQTPDKAVMVTNNYLYPGNVKASDEKGKLKDVKLNKSYAVVNKGEPYIVTSFGFYPLKKSNNDFIFTGKAKVSPGAGSMIATSMFGTLGTLLANGGDDATFLMKIDHKNGAIIKLKEIAEVKSKAISNGDSWD